MADLARLLSEVGEAPSDWERRVVAVEELARHDRLAEARLMVRDAPDVPVPWHLQKRLWAALSPVASPEPPPVRSTNHSPRETSPAAEKSRLEIIPLPPQEQAGPAPLPAVDLELPEPGPSGALAPERGKPMRKAKAGDAEPSARFRIDYIERRNLGDLSSPPQTTSRLNAFTIAFLIHLAVAVVLSFTAIVVPLAAPPQLTVQGIQGDDMQEIERKTIIQKAEKLQPAAPSSAPAQVMTVVASSPIVVPAFESNFETLDINLINSGIGDSRGLSFEGEGAESNVEFFGIQAGGRRIVFIVDATPRMLVDEKGGMFAYDKVKEEIGAMLTRLNRGTAFNIILYDGKRLSLFRDQPVRALNSNVQRAIRWLDPLNREYEALGLRENFTTGGVREGMEPVLVNDIAHYGKALQAALEMDVNAIFCITSGWQGMDRSLSADDQLKLAQAQAKRRESMQELTYDPGEQEAWRKAVQKAQDWLEKENAARRERGLPPKVVLDMGALVRELSPSARPPRPREEIPPLEVRIERPPPYTPEDLEDHLRNLVVANYGRNKPDHPGIHLVLFLGEEEDIGDYEEHFQRLSRRNNGELRLLRGLAALQDVTKR